MTEDVASDTPLDAGVFIRAVEERDLPILHRWWNNLLNVSATGLPGGISLHEVHRQYRARPTGCPYEEWIAICVGGRDEPVGVIVVAPHHPEGRLVSIGSIIVDGAWRRRGIGRAAVRAVERWAAERFPGLTLRLGAFEAFPEDIAFCSACAYIAAGIFESDYRYRGQKQRVHRFEKPIPPWR